MDTSRLARGTESWYLKELQQERSGFLDDLTEFIKRSARSIMPKQGDVFTPDQSRLETAAASYLNSGAGIKFWGSNTSAVSPGKLFWPGHAQRIIDLVTELVILQGDRLLRGNLASTVQRRPGSSQLPASEVTATTSYNSPYSPNNIPTQSRKTPGRLAQLENNSFVDVITTVRGSSAARADFVSSDLPETPLHFASVVDLVQTLVKWRREHGNEKPPGASRYAWGNMNKYRNCTRVAMQMGEKMGEIKQFKIDSKFAGWMLEHLNRTYVYVKRTKAGSNRVRVHGKRVYCYQAWLGEDRGWSHSTLYTTFGPETRIEASADDLEDQQSPIQALLDYITVPSEGQSHQHEDRGSKESTTAETVRDQSRNDAGDLTTAMEVLSSTLPPVARDQSEISPQTAASPTDESPACFDYTSGSSKHKQRAQHMLKSSVPTSEPCPRCSYRGIRCLVTQADKACVFCVSDGRGTGDCRRLKTKAKATWSRSASADTSCQLSSSGRYNNAMPPPTTRSTRNTPSIRNRRRSLPRNSNQASTTEHAGETTERSEQRPHTVEADLERASRQVSNIENVNSVIAAAEQGPSGESQIGGSRSAIIPMKRERTRSPEVEVLTRAQFRTVRTGSKPEIVFRFIFDPRVGIAPAVKPASIYTVETFFEAARKHWMLMNSHRAHEKDDMLGVEMSWDQPERRSFVGWGDDTGFDYTMRRVREVKPDADKDIEVEVRCVPKKQLETGE